jgi:hypothetical protein
MDFLNRVVTHFVNKDYVGRKTGNLRRNMLNKANDVKTGGRVVIALPTAITSWTLLFAKATIVKLVDVIAKPILKSTNVIKDSQGQKFSHKHKVGSWMLMPLKVVLAIPTIAISAVAFAIIAPGYIIVKTGKLMNGHGQSARSKILG